MKSKFKIVFLSFTLFFLLFQLEIVNAEQVNVTRKEMLDVAKEIHPPGCTDSMTADYCTLSTAYETRKEIWDLLRQGNSKEEVIQILVDKYGERILASPVKKGFHLLAWILPGIAILIGGTIIFILIRKWLHKKAVSGTSFENETVSQGVEKRVQDELKNWL